MAFPQLLDRALHGGRLTPIDVDALRATRGPVPPVGVDSRLRRYRLAFAVLAAVFALTVAARFWMLPGQPGLEWDEPVYYSVSQNRIETGELRTRESLGVSEPYLYQPPFYFLLQSSWLRMVGENPGSPRILTAAASLATLVLLYVMLRHWPGRLGALAVLAVVATDGWLVFSSRIALIENLMFPIAILGLLIYRWAYESSGSRRHKLARYMLAGAVIGFAAVFKHTGAYVLLVLPLHWAIIRRDGREHLTAVGIALLVLAAYGVTMLLIYGTEFLEQNRVQLLRALGVFASRGSIGPMDLIRAAVSTYSVFLGTIVCAVLSLTVVAATLLRAVRKRTLASLRGEGSLYLAWTLAALLSFAALGLRFPQYFMLVLTPLYVYAGSEVVQRLRHRQSRQRWGLLLVCALCGLAILNTATFIYRFTYVRDNAIAEASAFVTSHVPQESVVLADEPIGVLIPQTYVNTDLWALGISRPVRPDYIVTYESLSQKLPESAQLRALIAGSRPLFTVKGFKETITVYEVRDSPYDRPPDSSAP